jgi:hypothetical protein
VPLPGPSPGEAVAAAGPLAGDAAAADLPTVGVATGPGSFSCSGNTLRFYDQYGAIAGNGADPAIPIDHWAGPGIAST